jgi:predicted TIM-barrel fold metal-dependent hydrolase
VTSDLTSSVEPVETTSRIIEGLGLSGLFDVHTHFLPPRVMAKVRHQFDSAGPLIGGVWPLQYRGPDEELVETLRGFGVRRFSALAYAHKPQMAEFLNDWSSAFADRTPGCLRSATFYPEPDAAASVARRVAEGAEIFMVHVQVGGFDVRDPLLADVWGLLADARTPVVIHAGSGPVGTPYTGPGPVADLLRAHPRLALVIAHLGAPEYADFLDLVAAYEHVRADTTMVFTPFFDQLGAAFPADLVPRLVDLQPKILLGSDFPNIPYPYADQLTALAGLDLGDDWLRDDCWSNGASLFGDPAGESESSPARSSP